jgi:excisionase family DNA binding protein
VDREALRPHEAAALIGVGRNRLRELLASGELPAIRLGPRSVRIPLSALREWIAKNTTIGSAGRGSGRH